MEITMKWTVDSKSDEDAKKKVKALLNTAYGDLITPGDMYPDIGSYVYGSYAEKLNAKIDRLKMDLQNRDDEIQDLKLENDRLKKREDLYRICLNKFDCHGVVTCIRCAQYCPENDVPCKLALPINRHEIINELKKKLEALG